VSARWTNLPVRCRCSHGVSAHTGGSGRCFGTVCACQRFRDKAEWDAAQQRHPAGRDLPQTADVQDYLRAKGEM